MTDALPVHLCRIAPAGYLHHRAFDEVVETFAAAINELQVPVDVRWNELPPEGLNIVFGAHLLEPAVAASLPAWTVVCNFEQIDLHAAFNDWRRLQGLRQATVWDYSAGNAEYVRALTSNPRVRHVPLGYVPSLTRIAAHSEREIDVLFYGSLNPRRAQMLEALRDRGLEVRHLFGIYGQERDAAIARAKVVLNLHYYEARRFELVRVSYLLANRTAVVAECDAGTELPEGIDCAVCLAPYERLPETVVRLVGDAALRTHYANAGFRWMSARAAAPLLEAALRDALAARALAG